MALLTGLRAYYKLDESSGNPADSSGNGYTLTNTSMTYAAGKINNGGSFNGSADSTIASNLGMTGSSLMSFNFWIKINTQPSSNYSFISLATKTGGNKYVDCWYKDNAGSYQLKLGQSGGGITYNATFTTGTWYMITCLVDFSTANSELYVNGSSVSSGSISLNFGNTDSFKIGANLKGDGSPVKLTGMMDEVGVWDKTLTSTEITQLYNGGAGLQYPFTTTNSNFLAFM